MDSVEAAVEAQFIRWKGTGVGAIERDVLGTDHPREIAELFERFCVGMLGTRPLGALFYVASAGCVLGIHLESGEDIVVKVFQDRWGASLLSAVQAAQELVAAGGIPCALPLSAPARFAADRNNLALVETWLPDPGMLPGRSSRGRRISAGGLARQITLCSGMASDERLAQHPLRTPDRDLYPAPHSPLFDFAATAAGAEWIDELARRALSISQQTDDALVVAHMDWSARNVRFNEWGLLAVYDWDSVSLVGESTAVGQAAMTWSVTADAGGTEFPEMDDVLAFVDDYDRAQGGDLTLDQLRAARASAIYSLAYTARCEHSLDARGLARADQDAARRRLRSIGQPMLDL
jgi:hypothetical protein